MADFSSLLSKQLSSAFGSLQSRYSTTPRPKTLPLNQSATFSNPYKFNQETLQWSPLTKISAGTSHIEAEKRLCVFTWDIGPLTASAVPETMSKAIDELKSLLPAPDMIVVLLLRNVPRRLLPQILAHPFIRRTFLASDINALSWPGLGPGKPAESGTVVLADRESQSLLQAVFRVRVAFGEGGEGGEDVCFVDFRMRDGVVGRIGILAGEQGAEAAEAWVKAENVRWGVVAGENWSEEVRIEGYRDGVFGLGAWEIGNEEVPENPPSEYGLLMTRFKVNL